VAEQLIEGIDLLLEERSVVKALCAFRELLGDGDGDGGSGSEGGSERSLDESEGEHDDGSWSSASVWVWLCVCLCGCGWVWASSVKAVPCRAVPCRTALFSDAGGAQVGPLSPRPRRTTRAASLRSRSSVCGGVERRRRLPWMGRRS
jgi:hypothetical protein